MGLFTPTPARSDGQGQAPAATSVWIVDDEPEAAQLAVELAGLAGAQARAFRDHEGYLAALQADPSPLAVVLDWRLERELASAVYLATRHRLPRLPVIFWTASREAELPVAMRSDPATRIVRKTDGIVVLEEALQWALDQADHRREPTS